MQCSLWEQLELWAEPTSFLLHGLFDRGQAALELRIFGVVLQTGLVCIICAEQVSLAVEGGGFTPPALAPVWLELGGLLGVLEGVVPVLLGGVGGGSVGVEDVVVGLQGDGLGEFVASSRMSAFCSLVRETSGEQQTYMASSKFFSAMALLPRALSSSADAMVK